MLHSFTEENYLKAIFKLSENSDTVSTSDIATELNIRAATVTDMLKKLSAKKLIKYQKYRGVTMTDVGRRASIKIIRKHRLWELFLVEKMKFKWDEVHEIAEQLEHIKSDALIDRLDDLLGHPTHDPHGDPIPDKNGVLGKQRSVPLSEIRESVSLTVAAVSENNDSFLRYLNKIGVGLGTRIRLISVEDFDGSHQIAIEGGNTIFISSEVARNLLVNRS